uniref:Uncharacterized protein n=1 Tax=Ixodes ricinus TaxID=34613 RepID=A0A6B0U9E7_IXORI
MCRIVFLQWYVEITPFFRRSFACLCSNIGILKQCLIFKVYYLVAFLVRYAAQNMQQNHGTTSSSSMAVTLLYQSAGFGKKCMKYETN